MRSTPGRALVASVVLLIPSALSSQTQPASATAPRLTGYVQARFQSSGDSALFFVRRARIGAQGSLSPWASFKVQVELRTGGTAAAATVSATDLYVGLAHRQWSGTIGQFKTPFGRELLLSSTALELPDRALVVDALVPNRDIGVMAQWEQPGRVTIQGGAFNGEGINRARNTDNRMLYIGRVVVTPMTGVAVGGAVAAGSDSTRLNAEVSTQRRGWTARAEYFQRHREAPADEARGWYALAAYTLRPRRVQLVGRVEQFDASGAPDNRITGYTGGFQYFFRGDDLKALASYGLFVEQGASLDNNRFIVQLQGRF